MISSSCIDSTWLLGFFYDLLFLVFPRNEYYLNMNGSPGYGPETVRVDFWSGLLEDLKIPDAWKGAPLKPNGIAFLFS